MKALFLTVVLTLASSAAFADMTPPADSDFTNLSELSKGAEVMSGVICKDEAGTVVLKKVSRRAVWNTDLHYLIDASGNPTILKERTSADSGWVVDLTSENGVEVKLGLSPERSQVMANDLIVSKGTLSVGTTTESITCFGKTLRFI
jgi:hypothetical protein